MTLNDNYVKILQDKYTSLRIIKNNEYTKMLTVIAFGWSENGLYFFVVFF